MRIVLLALLATSLVLAPTALADPLGGCRPLCDDVPPPEDLLSTLEDGPEPSSCRPYCLF